LSRLEVMVLMAGMDLPVRAIREQIASAVDIIVQQTRFSDGRRRVTAIVEVDGMEGEVILTQPLFAFKQRGVGASGEILGEYVGFGQAPRFYEDLAESGVHLERAVFGSASEVPRSLRN
jgi:pilus assembly protein CpaF